LEVIQGGGGCKENDGRRGLVRRLSAEGKEEGGKDPLSGARGEKEEVRRGEGTSSKSRNWDREDRYSDQMLRSGASPTSQKGGSNFDKRNFLMMEGGKGDGRKWESSSIGSKGGREGKM